METPVDPGLRLMLYDATCRGRRGLPGLSAAWRNGGRLYHGLRRLDAWNGATTWEHGLDWLNSVQPRRAIRELQYWGHGNWGKLLLDRRALDASALRPGHCLHPRLVALRERLAPGPTTLLWLRTCEAFGTAAGHDFARRLADFFGCRVAGHTFVIGVRQSGLHSLRPGETPTWPVTEGLPDGPGPHASARTSRWREVNTISCLRGAIPDGY